MQRKPTSITIRLLFPVLMVVALISPSAAVRETPKVNAMAMFSGALVAESFEGSTLNPQTWHRPDWLVKNDTNLNVRVEKGHLCISGVSRPIGGDHQYTGILSTYFRETDVVLAARLRVLTVFDNPGRVRHLVHLCTGDWPDYFTEIGFGSMDAGPPRWFSGYVNKYWEYHGYAKFLEPTLPATDQEATDWHEVLTIHDGTTHTTQNYLVQHGQWKPVGPPHLFKMNHSHVELKTDVGIPGVHVAVDFDDVRLYPSPARHPVTIVDGPLNDQRTALAFPIEKFKVRLIAQDSPQLLGEGLTDEGGQAQVTLRSDLIYPVAARIEVLDGAERLVTSTISQADVRGLYPADIWVVSLPKK